MARLLRVFICSPSLWVTVYLNLFLEMVVLWFWWHVLYSFLAFQLSSQSFIDWRTVSSLLWWKFMLYSFQFQTLIKGVASRKILQSKSLVYLSELALTCSHFRPQMTCSLSELLTHFFTHTVYTYSCRYHLMVQMPNFNYQRWHFIDIRNLWRKPLMSSSPDLGNLSRVIPGNNISQIIDCPMDGS